MKMHYRALLLLICCFTMSCATASGGRSRSSKKGPLRVPGSATIQSLGFAVDASYDPRLDGLVPGYRVLNVALINSSMNIILLHPEKDRWFVKIGKNQKKPAFIDLRRHDAKAWSQVPKRARDIMSYPLAVPIGARMVLDLFVSEDVALEQMTELHMQLFSVGKRVEVQVSD